MTGADPTRSRHEMLVQLGTMFTQVSVEVYEPARPRGTVFCLHDFVGNGADFEVLARFLVANRFRVVCPDFYGRGQSAAMADPKNYTSTAHLTLLMQVMQKFATRRFFVLGKGWGALMVLLLVRKMQFNLAGLIVADLRLGWSVDKDPSIGEMQGEARYFPTAADATALVGAGTEFIGVEPSVVDAIAMHRVRETAAGFTLHYDPALRDHIHRLSGRIFEVGELVEAVRCRMLYVTADALTDRRRQAVGAVTAEFGGAAIGNFSPGGRMHFTTPQELLLVLGFLTASVLPA